MKIRPHETPSSDSAASANQNVTFKVHGSHSGVGVQMEELVHNTSSHSASAFGWKRDNAASGISKLLSWLQMLESCSQIEKWEKSSRCTWARSWQGCQAGLFYSHEFWARTSLRDRGTRRKFLLFQSTQRWAWTTGCVVWSFTMDGAYMGQERFYYSSLLI